MLAEGCFSDTALLVAVKKKEKMRMWRMQDFVSMLSGHLRNMEGCPEGRLLKMTFPHQQFGLSDDFTDQHSAVQYILLCKTFAQAPSKA